MVYLPEKASRARIREAENARRNRLEIVKALSTGQMTKRDLIKWGAFTAGGFLALKNGLSPYASSSFAAGTTGATRSPTFGAQPFTQPFQRVNHVKPLDLRRDQWTDAKGKILSADPNDDRAVFLDKDGNALAEPAAKRLSYHTDFNAKQTALGRDPLKPAKDASGNEFRNPLTNQGPMEGRPWGEAFSHQRWDEFFPKKGYVLNWGQCKQPDALGRGGTRFHPNMAPQAPNAIWTYGVGSNGDATMPPKLIKLRYGEPVLTRVYNRLPTDPAQNGGFGRNQSQLHFHNMHNGAESDGAANVHHYPGTFYDYRWSTTLARRDKTNTKAENPRASGPDGNGGLKQVAGDFREIQGTMWAHDHRFFFTAENVYKGNLMMCNLYSGPDRGKETLDDGVNLRLPSGSLLDWGNNDFDVNLIVSDAGTDLHGQCIFDIFTTDGFIGDVSLVNFAYKPVLEVLPRKYRFRTINCSMSRFIKLAIANPSGKKHPFTFIANDGNLVVNPIDLTELDEQGIAERYDIIVDFSGFKKDDEFFLVNLLQQTSGNKPDGALAWADALNGKSPDPCTGRILKFKVVDEVESVDVPGHFWKASDPDLSQIPLVLTEQIPIDLKPVRTRVVEFGRGNGDSRGANGQCTPDCSEVVQAMPWVIKVNGQAAHSMNANRISELIPNPGEIEHWTYVNGGGGWDHPIHLHFEEGVTMNRGNQSIPKTEQLVRKDVWRLRPAGTVQFQVQFGEYGGSYVNHCHNTVHEDFALLMRIQLIGDKSLAKDAMDPTKSVIRGMVTATPNPTPWGVIYTDPIKLAEGDPANTKFFKQTNSGSTPTTTTPTTTTSTTTSGKTSGGTAKPSGKG